MRKMIREGLTRKKKKSVNFHTFGPDPPPLKSVKLKIFFFYTITETYFGGKSFQKNVFLDRKLKKISRFFPNMSKKLWLLGKRVPPPYTEKNFLWRFAWFRTWKKKKGENNPILAWPPPLLVWNFPFFF